MENSTIFHNEIETLRLVIPTAGVTHPILGAFTNKGIIPAAKQMTGTISSYDTDTLPGITVTGVGTTFLTGSTDKLAQIEDGDFIYDPAQKVARRVKLVLSDTRLLLYAKFPSPLVAVNLWKIPRSYHKIYAKSTGSADAIMEEATFRMNDTFLNSGAPISYDVSTAGAEISFELSL